MIPNRMTYVAHDRLLSINDIPLFGIDEDLVSWIPENIHAIQWYGEEYGGDIEYTSNVPFGEKPPNQRIFELGEFERLIEVYDEQKRRNEEKILLEEQERLAQELAVELSRDYWTELRNIRDKKLLECDWTQLSDAPLTEEQKNNWLVYRQQLRDLPENIEDPKPLVWAYHNNQIHPDWPVPPQ